jgi:hypothetical protein
MNIDDLEGYCSLSLFDPSLRSQYLLARDQHRFVHHYRQPTQMPVFPIARLFTPLDSVLPGGHICEGSVYRLHLKEESGQLTGFGNHLQQRKKSPHDEIIRDFV